MGENEKPRFMNVKEVAEMLDVSESKAYKVIKGLNDELEGMGKITIAGKISRRYFEEKLYL